VCATHAAPRSRRPGRWQRQQRGSWGVVLLAGCGRGKERIGIGGGLRKGAVFARGAAEKRSGPPTPGEIRGGGPGSAPRVMRGAGGERPGRTVRRQCCPAARADSARQSPNAATPGWIGRRRASRSFRRERLVSSGHRLDWPSVLARRRGQRFVVCLQRSGHEHPTGGARRARGGTRPRNGRGAHGTGHHRGTRVLDRPFASGGRASPRRSAGSIGDLLERVWSRASLKGWLSRPSNGAGPGPLNGGAPISMEPPASRAFAGSVRRRRRRADQAPDLGLQRGGAEWPGEDGGAAGV